MRAGVLDIGSYSTLLLIGERGEAGWRTLLDTARITRLGEGFSITKTLQPQAIERTMQAVEEYLALCRAMSVEKVIAVATAVVREARNSQMLTTALRQRLPAHAQFILLSEADEARYSFLSVARDTQLALGDERVAVVDIGGGSVEVALGRHEVEQSFSFPLGAVRVRETLMPSDPPEPREVLAAVRALDEMFEPLRALPQPDRVVAIGGTGVNLAMLALQSSQFDPVQAHGVWFGDETPAALLERLLRLSDAERRTLPGIESGRAPLLHIGALILERVLFALRHETVQISARGVRYGVLWSLCAI
ncbi:MAG: hypothetical protein NZ874_09720 [Fimbriimonadales bacterium]|nr:hypothetical protein [Fimbriimonadales bacterium]